MTPASPVPAVTTTPALVQLIEVRHAVDGVRTAAENPYPYAPARAVPVVPPAVQRTSAVGSLVDRYL